MPLTATVLRLFFTLLLTQSYVLANQCKPVAYTAPCCTYIQVSSFTKDKGNQIFTLNIPGYGNGDDADKDYCGSSLITPLSQCPGFKSYTCMGNQGALYDTYISFTLNTGSSAAISCVENALNGIGIPNADSWVCNLVDEDKMCPPACVCVAYILPSTEEGLTLIVFDVLV